MQNKPASSTHFICSPCMQRIATPHQSALLRRQRSIKRCYLRLSTWQGFAIAPAMARRCDLPGATIHPFYWFRHLRSRPLAERRRTASKSATYHADHSAFQGGDANDDGYHAEAGIDAFSSKKMPIS